MRRLFFFLLVLLALFVAAAFVWPTRWRYDHITVDSDSYLVRIDRLTGHVDILMPETGWIPSEQPWDEEPAPDADRHTAADPA